MHTPGPWKTVEDEYYNYGCGILRVESESGACVLTENMMAGEHALYFPNPEDKPLVLAAPDLLDALETAKHIIKQHVRATDIAGYSDIEDAIRKAKGETA
jgi:hypothetical protein